MERLLFREYREIAAPLSKEGIEVKEIRSRGHGGYVSAIEFPQGVPRPEVFTPSTVILNGGYGVWEIEIPQEIRQRLLDINLCVETVRTHGMLHTALPGKSASIYVNDQLVDKVHLVKPHPHGEDFGVDSRRQFPVLRYVDVNRPFQSVRLEVEDGVSWDVDRVSLVAIVRRRDLHPAASMVIGALISALFGVIASLLVR